MSSGIRDFVLTGNTVVLNCWVSHARDSKVLWCFEHEKCKGSQCNNCARPGYCGIVSPAGLLKVLPIKSAPNFTLADQQDLLLITPSKNVSITGSKNTSKIRLFLADFVSAFRGEAKLFESYVNNRDVVEWMKIPTL